MPAARSPSSPVFISLYLVLKNFSKHVPPGSDLSWLHFVPDITAKANSGWSGYVLLAIYAAQPGVLDVLHVARRWTSSSGRLMMVLPLIFITVIAHFPIGLVIYWVTTNLWTVGQGLVTRRLVPKTRGRRHRGAEALVADAPPAARGRRRERSGEPARSRPPRRSPGRRPSRASRRRSRGASSATAGTADDERAHGRGDRRDGRRGEVAGAPRARAARPVARQGRGAVPGRSRRASAGLLGVGYTPARVVATAAEGDGRGGRGARDESEAGRQAARAARARDGRDRRPLPDRDRRDRGGARRRPASATTSGC